MNSIKNALAVFLSCIEKAKTLTRFYYWSVTSFESASYPSVAITTSHMMYANDEHCDCAKCRVSRLKRHIQTIQAEIDRQEQQISPYSLCKNNH